MTIKEIARNIAKGDRSDIQERLLRAEGNLIREFYPALKKMEIDQIIEQRYTSSPAVNEIAAIEILPLLFSVNNDPNASPKLVAAAKEFIAVAEESDIAPEFLEETWDVWDLDEIQKKGIFSNGDPDRIEKALRKTAGLRSARKDVEARFEELLKQGFDEEAEAKYSAFINSIEDELANYQYSGGFGGSHERIINE